MILTEKFLSQEHLETELNKYGLEGKQNISSYEECMCLTDTKRVRLERILLLDCYDNSRPTTVYFTDINGDRSKGYMGWREG